VSAIYTSAVYFRLRDKSANSLDLLEQIKAYGCVEIPKCVFAYSVILPNG
jgi:hypothetical protein